MSLQKEGWQTKTDILAYIFRTDALAHLSLLCRRLKLNNKLNKKSYYGKDYWN